MPANEIWCLLLVLAAVSVGRADASTMSHSDARKALLQNVRVINSGGAPGIILCAGSNAFPVVGAKCGRSVQPVAAACFYGRGRVLAVGHPSFYTEEGASKADTAAFIRNGVIWLGQGKVSVVVYKNAPIAKTLKGVGDLDVREIPCGLSPHISVDD